MNAGEVQGSTTIKSDRTGFAIFLMIAAMIGFALADTLIKWSSETAAGGAATGQIMVYLGISGLILFGVTMAYSGERLTRHTLLDGMVLFRTFGDIIGVIGVTTSLTLMPVGAGFCYALFVVTTRRLCRDESPVALVIASNVMILAVGVLGLLLIPKLPILEETREHYPFLLTVNAALTSVVIVVILFCSFLNTAGNLCLSKAYQSADSSFLAPFDYMYLLFATFWGVVLIGDLPDSTTVTGLFLIAGAGVFVAWRERQLNAGD